MACEVRMYCDRCGTNMLVDQFGDGSFRKAVSDAIFNAKSLGFRRVAGAWVCPGCLVGMPNVFDIDNSNEADRSRAIALLKKRGIDLSKSGLGPIRPTSGDTHGN